MNNLDNEELKEFLRRQKKGEIDPLINEEVSNIFQEKTISSVEKEARLAKMGEQMSHKLAPESQNVFIHSRRNSSVIWAAAAVIILITAAGLWLNSRNYFSTDTEQLAAVEPLVFSGAQLVKLADGSTALLNENSKLTITQSFGKLNREVSLIGEALFDVTHDETKPFIVHTGKISTRVLGTSFNVNSSQDKVTVTVVRGLVQVGDELNVFGKINPDEQMEVDVASSDFVVRNSKAEEVTAWQNEFFILDNVTFEEAAQAIEKRFNVKVSFENEQLRTCKVNAWFSHGETLQQIVDAITSTREAIVTISENNVVISGGIACEEN